MTDEGVGKIFGAGNYRFRLVEGWGMGPDGRLPGGRVSTVGVDSQDRVYVIVRGPIPVLVYDREGRFLDGWGADLFQQLHGIWIAPDDTLYLADHRADIVRRCTAEGKVLATWNSHGADGKSLKGAQKAIVASDGEMYIADGNNYQVHRYSPESKWISSWGTQGSGPGEFDFPCSIDMDRKDRILIADRENNRLQIFDRDGNYQTEWAVPKPNDVFVDRDGMIYVPEEEKRKIDIFNDDGELVCQWGERGKRPEQFRNFLHNVCLDSRGDLYICGMMIDDMLQKFERV